MPFQTTSIAPPLRPKVTVAFAGLMVLQPGANNTCEVGIHRLNKSHEIRATLIVQRPNRPPILVSLLQGPLEAPFEISLDSAPNPLVGDFSVFAPTAEPFIRDAGTNNEFDYRWAVNVKDLHPNVELNEGAQPFVILKTGILYTASRTRDTVKPSFVRDDGLIKDMHKIATNLAAAIITPDTHKVHLSWQDRRKPVELELPRTTNDPVNTCYTVMFTNEPTKLRPEPHKEMALYYKILRDGGAAVKDEERFEIEYEIQNPGTDEVPCLTMTRNP